MSVFYHFLSLIAHIKTYVEIKVFQKRFFLLHKTGKKFIRHSKSEKLLIVIPHVVPNAHIAQQEKLTRLINCLDCLLCSIASYNFKILLLSKEGFSLAEHLPEYLREKVDVTYSTQPDPMFIGFDAFEQFKAHAEDFDYFMFMEDDILLSDSWFLEKIKQFNQSSPSPNYVLLPHRFEYFKGVKYYLDQMAVTGEQSKRYTYTEQLNFTVDHVQFCIYENPHAGFYCLNRTQLSQWISSGNRWKNKAVAFGPLESAATFCLFENFKLFKPHPDDMDYFLIQHFGNKYIYNDKVITDNTSNV